MVQPRPAMGYAPTMDDGRALPDDIDDPAEASDRFAEDGTQEAIALYRLLSPGARRSLRSVAGLGDANDHAALGHAIGSVIVQHGLAVLRKRGAQWAERAYPGDALSTEGEEVDEAIRLVREARAATA